MLFNHSFQKIANYFQDLDNKSSVGQYVLDDFIGYKLGLDENWHFSPGDSRGKTKPDYFAKFLFRLFEHGDFETLLELK